MTKIATTLNRVGGVLKHEYEPSQLYCREAVVFADGVLVTPDLANGTGDQVGLVVFYDGATWVPITEALMAGFTAATDKLGVIIDDQIEEFDLVNSGTNGQEIAVLVNGPAIVRKGGLDIQNVTTSEDEIYAQLESQNIKVAAKFSF